MLTKHGHWSCAGTTHRPHRLYSAFPSKKVRHICSEEASHSPRTSSFSGQPSARSTPSTRTSSSSCGFIMISATITSSYSIWASRLVSVVSLPIRPTLHVRWLTCGRRSAVATAPGTTAIDSASSGKSKTTTCSATTSCQVTGDGYADTELSTLLGCGLQTPWV